jgi:hypothetical protein
LTAATDNVAVTDTTYMLNFESNDNKYNHNYCNNLTPSTNYYSFYVIAKDENTISQRNGKWFNSFAPTGTTNCASEDFAKYAW